MSRWKLIHERELDKADTGLRFTDVLFGFVIKELFTRLIHWSDLSGTTRAHLVAGCVLVLGSYIGFRKSLHRGNLKLFFFNLPLVRFILDQAMVVLYFRFATVTGDEPMPDAVLVRVDVNLLIWIFLLYMLWDCVSWLMIATNGKGHAALSMPTKYDIYRLGISLGIFLVFLAMGLASSWHNLAESCPVSMEVAAIVFLVVYRVLKDARV